jgi:hypothetical protein
MMSNITEIVHVEVAPGTDIDDAIAQSVQLSKDRDCIVKFDFKGRWHRILVIGEYISHIEGDK